MRASLLTPFRTSWLLCVLLEVTSPCRADSERGHVEASFRFGWYEMTHLHINLQEVVFCLWLW